VEVSHAEARTFGFDGEGFDAALVSGEEEVLRVIGAKAGTGDMGNTAGAAIDVVNRGNDVSGLSFKSLTPHTFFGPGNGGAGTPQIREATGAGESNEVLVTRVPTIVAAFDDVADAGAIATTAVVVNSEKIAVLIEGQVLGIAIAVAEDLDVAAVGIAAEDGACMS
jgi:hypothetical protein